MKEKLLSLQSSGESLEKALSILYTSLQSNEKFYSDFNVLSFYGHNLPKKNKNLNVHGTIGFYSQFLSDITVLPYCSKEYILQNKKNILERLCISGKITERSWYKISLDKEIYWDFIRNLPFEYLYPEYYKKIITNSCALLSIKEISQLYLEKKWPRIVYGIDKNAFRYSIYALEENGCIGKYSINNKINLIENLSRKACVSGNSAILLRTIGYRIGAKTIIGYRLHRRSVRPNRNYELNELLNTHASIIEPSNIRLNKEFDLISTTISDEEKTNYVFAKIFREYIKCNYKELKL